MPCFLAALYSSIEPFMTPWSVRPSAGWPNSAARAARASILHAPSSSEYSEWTCRCAQAGPAIGNPILGAGSDRAEGGFRSQRGSGLGRLVDRPAAGLGPLGPGLQPADRLEVAAGGDALAV